MAEETKDQTGDPEVEGKEGEETKPDETEEVEGETDDEAEELVEKGKKFKELSEKYPDINFEELPKSFTQAKQELALLKKSNEGKTESEIDPADLERQKQIEKFFADEVVRKQISGIVSQNEDKIKADIQRLKADIAFQQRLDELEAEYDGEDGKPKFNRDEVIAAGEKYNFVDPEIVYKELHETKLDEWKLKQAMSKKGSSTYSEKRGGMGSKMPPIKTPSTFEEAREAAKARLESLEG